MFDREMFNTVFANVNDFAKQAGVTFAIHVYYRSKKSEQAEVMSLGDPLNATKLLGVSPSNHPDQQYLNKVKSSVLNSLGDVDVVRVEVDDTISFCGTNKGDCGQVVPDWVKKHFPEVPALLFVHKSDITKDTLGGKHVYDFHDSSRNESWQWANGTPSITIGGAPSLRYVAVYTCNTTTCSQWKKNFLLVEVRGLTQKGQQAIDLLSKKAIACACKQTLSYQQTRVMLSGDKPAVELY